jgi:tetratricopeptide (TPR) repeat protein
LVYAHANLGLLLVDIGHVNEGVGHLEQAHRLRPEDPSILVNLGVARTRISSFQAAEAFREALEIEPGHVDATLNLAHVLSRTGRSAEAVEHYEAALARNPDSTALQMALANSLAEVNRFDEAVRRYQAIIAANPTSARPYLALGNVYRMFGRFQEAYDCHVKVRELKPDNLEALVGVLRFLKSRVPAADAHRATQMADDSSLPAEQRWHLHFALAACNESGGRYDAAFYHMDRGNELRRMELEPKGGPYDPKREGAKVDRIIAAFGDDYFVRTRSFGLRTKLPVFVVGMPRSGTTLCEQVLASHSEIVGADELPDIPLLVHELRMTGSPNCKEDEEEGTTWTQHLTADRARALAQRHLSRLEALASGAARVVDKGPANYYHLGLIATLFPGASVIHCRRDPMDIALSCYSKDFALAPIWVNDLRSIGHVYCQYDRLMDHWRRVLPIKMLELRYEDVVADLEGSARRLIAYCGLEWDNRCLRFYETGRRVKTASVEQVHRPIYDSSVGRWRKYERHLAPLREALGFSPTKHDF